MCTAQKDNEVIMDSRCYAHHANSRADRLQWRYVLPYGCNCGGTARYAYCTKWGAVKLRIRNFLSFHWFQA